MGNYTYLKDVVTLELNEEKCVGCGVCKQVCPHAVFRMEERKALVTDRNLCMECGACALNCPAEAIKVRSGVGCAAGILKGKIRKARKKQPDPAKETCCCEG
ncbi:MAG: 4Fe-4S dicluster domain-containing protein [bacterium]|nr:4Fe-4S dicluster domain-containing protein [bacterium]